MDEVSSSTSSGGTGGGSLDPEGLQSIFWSIPDFFIGAVQTFTSAFETVLNLIPNPDPFPDMIENLGASGDTSMINMVVWWLDTAYDLLFIQDMLAGWLAMMVVSIFIGLFLLLVKAALL